MFPENGNGNDVAGHENEIEPLVDVGEGFMARGGVEEGGHEVGGECQAFGADGSGEDFGYELLGEGGLVLVV